jgi:hypothetical protein
MKAANKLTLVISTDFSSTPGPRHIREGDFSGESLRKDILAKKLQQAIDENTQLFIDLDGTSGYGTSFLEEAFGGLIRIDGYSYETIRDHIKLKSEEEEYLLEDIEEYLNDAKNKG